MSQVDGAGNQGFLCPGVLALVSPAVVDFPKSRSAVASGCRTNTELGEPSFSRRKTRCTGTETLGDRLADSAGRCASGVQGWGVAGEVMAVCVAAACGGVEVDIP